ncbi:MAG: thioredoxin domain-containing protein [Phycisphaerae bacterium]
MQVFNRRNCRYISWRRGAKLFAVAALFVSAGGMSGTTCNGGGGGGGGGGGTTPTLLANDHVLGDPNALVKVFVYSDFQCPFCGRFERETYPTIKTNYIDTGKVYWIFRHFPLRNIHPNAEGAAEASECAADQGMFEDYKAKLYNNQSNLDVPSLKAFAGQLGMNQTTFDSCVDGGGKAARVQQDVDSGTALSVAGTPTFYINTTVVAGFQTVTSMSALLDQAITDAGGTP